MKDYTVLVKISFNSNVLLNAEDENDAFEIAKKEISENIHIDQDQLTFQLISIGECE